MNYDHNKMFGLLKFHLGYGKFNLNSPKGYSLKIINAQTASNNKVMGRTRFAARSRCDLDLQGRNPNVASDMSSQHGGNFCKIVLKSDFK